MKTFRIRVHPHSKEEKCLKNGERYEIFVKAKAKEGRANEEALKVLSRSLSVLTHQISIVRGRKSPGKTVVLREGEGGIKRVLTNKHQRND